MTKNASSVWRPWIPRWLPNAISVARILLVPVWVLCAEACRGAVLDGRGDEALSLRLTTVAVLVAIGVSDVIDGYLARKFDLISRTGATLDALADKLAQVALLVYFTVRGDPAFPGTPAWFLVLVLLRDLYLGAGWLAMRKRLGSVHVVHRFHGRFSSVLFFVLLVLLSLDVGGRWIDVLVLLITAFVVASTVAYSRDGFAQVRNEAPQDRTQ